MDMQNVSNLEIPEGEVRTIHDKDSRLLWGRVHYDTKYAGDTFQQAYSGYNLIDLVPITNMTVSSSQGCTIETVMDTALGKNVLHVTASQTYPSIVYNLPQRLESGKYYALRFTYKSAETYDNVPTMWFAPSASGNNWDVLFNLNAARCKSGDGDTVTSVPQSATWKTTSRRFYVDPTQYSNTTLSYNRICFSMGYNESNSQLQGKELWLADAEIYEITASEWNANNYTSKDYEPYVGSTSTQITPAPNPSYPQDINVVTGEQTVTVTGKNLFNQSDYFTSLGSEFNVSDATYAGLDCKKIKRVNATTYNYALNLSGQHTISFDIANAASDYYLFLVYSDNTTTTLATGTKTSWTHISVASTAGKDIVELRLQMFGWDADNNIYLKNIQLESGNQPTTYESFQSTTKTVDLTSKNLINPSTKTDGYRLGPDGQNYSDAQYSVTDYFMINPSTTYTFNRGISSTTNPSDAICFYDINKTFILRIAPLTSSSTTIVQFTSPANAYYARMAEYTYMFNAMQLEQGNQPTAYEPYYNYELAKIGTYQDYIYKDGDDWYVHKENGKIVFSGEESVSSLGPVGNVYRYYITNYAAQLTGLPQATELALCSHFEYGGITNQLYAANKVWFNASGGSTLSNGNVTFNIYDISTNADFKAWLGNNTPVLVYQLKTPTDTKITDSTLIGELNAIHEWLTRYGYYGTVSGNLPMIIDRTNL